MRSLLFLRLFRLFSARTRQYTHVGKITINYRANGVENECKQKSIRAHLSLLIWRQGARVTPAAFYWAARTSIN
jgi:hypothetical protein